MIQLSHNTIKGIKQKIVVFALAFVMSLAATPMQAQEISVASFRALENDLTANTYGTTEKDQNGEVAALIKIPTTAQGFTFDGGMTGIVKVLQRTGEIWVYVPHGIKRISIFHQQLGYLRDYYFPIAIEKARTYEMKLVTGQVQTVTNVTVQQQFVVFQVSPVDAMVELNDEVLIVNEQGMATKRMPYGRYTYRVSSPNYHTEAGVVQVTAESKAQVNVALKPHFGSVELAAAEEFHGAYVYLDGERVGQLPMKIDELKSGMHQFRIMKPSYKVLEQQVLVSDGETTRVEVALQSNNAAVTLISAMGGDIYLDGEYKATGQCTLNLEMGEYKAEVRKASHQSTSMLVQVSDNNDKTITLPDPVPLYGSLEVMSMPMGAQVWLDEEAVGETPLILNNILVGQHQLRLAYDKYESLQKSIEIEHSKTASVDVSLTPMADARADAKSDAHSNAATSQKTADQTAVEKPAAKPAKPTRENPALGKPANYYHQKLSLYAGAGANVMPTMQISVQAGAYFKGVNLEYHYAFEPNFETQQYSLRVGYGLPLGKTFLLTPQVGYGAFAGFDDYGKYRVLSKGLILACRAQACLSKSFSVALTPSYDLSQSAVGLNVSLVYNLPLAK